MRNDPNLSCTSIRKGQYLTWYRWTYNGILSSSEAAQKQLQAGYPPSGYGFHAFKVENGKTVWECSNTCD